MQQGRDPKLRWRREALEAYDPFAVNPLRRSLIALLVSGALVVGPPVLLSPSHAALALVTVGWIAMTVFVLSFPVLLICLVERLWQAVSRRIHPSVDELALSPRARNLLHRHGFDTIESIDRASETELLLLSNFDAPTVREVRRAVSLWMYRRWQESGFPDRGPSF
ncbi:MAG TPA: DNA-directed RNA polymerase subunit alpha C-terminal domain-containing protein [Thermomicrobiaceae bacterium]|nr:DNA-directed RNA polymerase subunit alpha C-terminal domain-containing protein [Thermomicrobiaceae bacterium]